MRTDLTTLVIALICAALVACGGNGNAGRAGGSEAVDNDNVVPTPDGGSDDDQGDDTAADDDTAPDDDTAGDDDATTEPCETAGLPLDKIQLPAGFKICVWAPDVPTARSLALGPNGTVFVGTRDDSVYALRDNDGDHRVDVLYTLASGLHSPNGVAVKDGSLYVAEISRITRYDDIENHLNPAPTPVLVTDQYPTDESHGWKYIRFGPDGKLYVPVGAPCNICERPDPYAGITRIDADGGNREVVARGVRNTVGLDWHPDTGELWFTDNGRDMLGDDIPSDELNHADADGRHFGFPYCQQGDILDPDLGAGKNCADYRPPALKLGAHVASLGMKFYTGSMFGADYQKSIFIAEHGSWNRSSKVGYRVVNVKLNGNNVASQEVFASGWLQGEQYWGRPVDVLVMPDGSLLVSDDYANTIYRISKT